MHESSATAVVMGSMCAATVRCYAAALKAGKLLIDLIGNGGGGQGGHNGD